MRHCTGPGGVFFQAVPTMNRPVRFLGLATLAVSVSCSGSDPTSPSTTAQEIVGGVDDTSHTNVVMLTNPSGSCTASLIAPNLVLTARHCVAQNVTQGIGCDINGNSTNGDHVGANYTASSLKVFTGATPTPWGTPAAVGAQLFTTAGKNLCNNDIALLVLNKAITSAPPLKIRRDYPPQIGEMVTAVGYGAINDNSFGSGKRRMRANVPVRTVGKDWNELTGEGELATGQAVCSGDSGGPILSAGGAVIGIASRVSKCTDPSATAKYVRLDYHKALINQAFAAAAASPSLEAGTGTPVTPKGVGESPCTTGAQCQSYLCSPGGYCTDFCTSTSCPTGMVCQDMSFPMFTQPVKACAPLTGGTPCEQCRNTECPTVVGDCLGTNACKSALACADACTDAACLDACKNSNSLGWDAYASVAYCVCNSSCATACSNHCATGSGGAAGAGGAPAGGGAAGAGAVGGAPMGGMAGTGGAAAGAAGTPQATGDSGSSGGCATSRSSDTSSAFIGLSLLGLAWARRRRARR